MGAQKRITKPQIIAFAIALLIPLAAIVLGVVLLIADALLNISFLLTFIAFPVCAILLLACAIFSKLKALVKTILTILLLVAFVIVFLCGNAVGKFEILSHYKNDDIAENYPVTEDYRGEMPALSEIGQTADTEYYDYFSSQLGIFTVDADFLICHYDENEYKTQKESISYKYVFQSDPMVASGYSCEPTVEINDYLFRTVSIKGVYPKNLFLIATNDNANEIVYLTFYDDDIDYIVSLEEFINEDCGWKHIR